MYLSEVFKVQKVLHRVLYHVLSVDLDLIEPLGEISCVLVHLVAEPD